MTNLKVSDFVLSNWGAWAPGLSCKDDWKAWCAGLRTIGAEAPEVPAAVPKMLQRRLSPLARAVFNAAHQCLAEGENLPTVLSSAHGEVSKSLEMLKAIQAGEELSPAAFSLSVHNAISGLFSIAYANQQEITVIAPGLEGIAPAFIEALGLLHEGAPTVGLILYDEPIANFYPVSPFKLNAEFPCALALKITLQGDGLPMRFYRSSKPRDDGEHPVQLLAFLRFLLAEDKSLLVGNQGHSWRWDKQ
jgi:Beta-ketoacyl synthase, N-terminal domain